MTPGGIALQLLCPSVCPGLKYGDCTRYATLRYATLYAGLQAHGHVGGFKHTSKVPSAIKKWQLWLHKTQV